jgi:hydroxymethylpyrimidine/phosphomethylpyrimidine kinase
MLGTKEIVLLVRDVLKQIKEMKEKVWIVLDPVMISTSGSKLIDDDAIEAIVQNLFPLVDIGKLAHHYCLHIN